MNREVENKLKNVITVKRNEEIKRKFVSDQHIKHEKESK
jgi:hypothetical protein